MLFILSKYKLAKRFNYKFCENCRGTFSKYNVNFSSSSANNNFAQSSDIKTTGKLDSNYDAIIVGGGHNGLVSAGYLGKAGFKTCVLERRHVLGGAAVTEEIVPGFKFSRASYVLSLLRPTIVKDLELKKHGLKVYLRNPSSYTPLLESKIKLGGSRSLTLYSDINKTIEQIAQFSVKDSKAYPKYEKYLDRFVQAIEPLLDNLPPNQSALFAKSPFKKFDGIKSLFPLLKTSKILDEDVNKFYEIATSSANKILDQWFESEPLKATLATDGVIGAVQSPNGPGTGYVLLHHVMGELEGVKGAWGYAEGGMGSVSQALARAAVANGAHINTSSPVIEIIVENGSAVGVRLADKSVIRSKIVLSNATPKVTFIDLLPKGILSEKLNNEIQRFDYSSQVAKINLALKNLPNFLANPNKNGNRPMPHHQATIHLNCEETSMIEDAFLDGQRGILPKRPMMEVVIPSSLDPTLAPDGCHVCHMFTQYVPYKLADGRSWNDEVKKEYLQLVLKNVDEYAPGFSESVIDGEVLSPIDLENIFGLTGGNIFHGSMSLDQLYAVRPFVSVSSPQTPVDGLYLCGSGAHPGGGVMGAAGRLAALKSIEQLKKC